MRRELANHKRLHFRPILAKTNDSFSAKFQKSRDEYFPDMGFVLKVSQLMTKFSAKVQKPYFWAIFHIFEKMIIFPKNLALSHFIIYGPIISCKISENKLASSVSAAYDTGNQKKKEAF